MTRMAAATNPSLFLSIFEQLWAVSSDAMLLVVVNDEQSRLHMVNPAARSSVDAEDGALLETFLPEIMATKLNVLCQQSAKSGSEVSYIDTDGNTWLLYPVEYEGAQFVLCILSNFASQLEAAKAKLASENEQVSDQPKSYQGKVLVAEDHPDNRGLICRLLQRMGLTVVTAIHGEEAVELALSEDFELILMDIQMPVLDGEMALQLLNQAGSPAPVIALTSNASPDDIEKYLEVGFVAHLAKPINQKQFFETINQHMSNSGDLDANQVNLTSEEYLSLKRQYIGHLPKDMAKLRGAFEQKDWRLVGKVAHAIKGSSGNFGFARLSVISGALEQAVDLHHLEAADKEMANLETEYQSYRLPE